MQRPSTLTVVFTPLVFTLSDNAQVCVCLFVSVCIYERAGKGHKQYAAYGYSLGATYRPTWMDTTDMNSTMIFKGNSLLLQPGMTFLFNLMVSDESGQEGGCGLSDTILITPGGCESLTSLPHELIVKPLQ